MKNKSKQYKSRSIDETINMYLDNFSAFLLIGAKGVGKTETCKQITNSMFELDKRSVREELELVPSRILSSPRPVLLDEWQYSPELWTFIRHEVDNGLEEGAIIFTGSAPRTDMKVHSGAGRIPRMKMWPFSIEERELSQEFVRISEMLKNPTEFVASGETQTTFEEYLDEIFRSGFPGIRDKKEFARKIQLENYIETTIAHDFEEQGFAIRKPGALLAWWKTYAASIATVTSFATILETASATETQIPTKDTARTYRDALEVLNLIEEVPAWLPMGKLMPNIAKTPKHFLIDPALAISLLEIEREQLMNYNPPKAFGKLDISFTGRLFENFIFQSLAVYSELNQAKLSHFRTNRDSREVDFIIQKGNTLLLFEVKTANTIDQKDVRHLNWFEEVTKDSYQVVKNIVYSGRIAYQREDGVNVIPAGMLGL